MSTLVPDEVSGRGTAAADDASTTHAEHPAGTDPFCILVWRFRALEANVEAFAEMCGSIGGPAEDEPKCLFRRVARNGAEFEVRAGFEDSYGVLTHVANFAAVVKAARPLAALEGLSIYGTDSELALLAEPLAPFDPLFVEQDFDSAI